MGRHAFRSAALPLVLVLAAAAPAAARQAAPFAPGEELIFRASISPFGRVGTAVMRISGPETLRGEALHLMSFDFDGRFGPARLEDRTRSWIDLRTLAAHRYTKVERSPFASHREEVDIFPAEGRWLADDGTVGSVPTRAPLDELSFLYYVRTLPLEVGAEHVVQRHFDAARNPVRIRVVRQERIRVPAGEFETMLVEMRVSDPRRFRSDVVIRINVSDDVARLPVRIASSIPGAATVTFALEAGSGARVVLR
jgi:hypothetical protein